MIVVVQPLSQTFRDPVDAACQDSLSYTVSRSLKLMFIKWQSLLLTTVQYRNGLLLLIWAHREQLWDPKRLSNWNNSYYGRSLDLKSKSLCLNFSVFSLHWFISSHRLLFSSTFLKIPHKKEKKKAFSYIFQRAWRKWIWSFFHYDMTLELTWKSRV